MICTQRLFYWGVISVSPHYVTICSTLNWFSTFHLNYIFRYKCLICLFFKTFKGFASLSLLKCLLHKGRFLNTATWTCSSSSCFILSSNCTLKVDFIQGNYKVFLRFYKIFVIDITYIRTNSLITSNNIIGVKFPWKKVEIKM